MRWKHVTGEAVDYAPSQEVASRFSEIPPDDFRRSVQLVEPDGRRSSGAQAVFRALALGGSPRWSWAYDRIPGFKPIAEWSYSLIAGNRPSFSWLTRLLWGHASKPESYRRTRWVFLRALALVYAIAFGSLGIQIKGLIGSQGILPVVDLLKHLTPYGLQRFWYIPSLVWIHPSDGMLVGICGAGILFSLALLLNLAPRFSLLALWVLYLSLVSVGGSFLSFQWDALLLETGFLAIFLAPAGLLPQWKGAASPGRFAIFTLKWLLFRLMLQSALVKWMSGDALWRQMTALTVHFQTQPLPNVLSWYVHQLPVEILKLGCVGMFLIEGFGAFLVFAPRRARQAGFWALVTLQGLILLTGNYTYFNLLTITLCLLLLDDAFLRPITPDFYEEPLPREEMRTSGRFKRGLSRLGIMAVVVLTLPHLLSTVGIPLPRWVFVPTASVATLRSFNSYGLFAVMTPTRPEIIVEGSSDGKNWFPYEFKHKPGNLLRRPPQIAPHQPRLDWQMWFAALGDYKQNQWFLALCVRLLQGQASVIDLMDTNPFPEKPPVMIRAWVYEYEFTTRAERRQTGEWWKRKLLGPYCPVLSLKK